MRRRPVQFALSLLAFLCLTHITCLPAEYSFQTDANVMVEVTLKSAQQYADPFNDVSLDGVFTTRDRAVLKVPGFWAGGDTWKIRFASPTPGIHKFKTECSNTKD